MNLVVDNIYSGIPIIIYGYFENDVFNVPPPNHINKREWGDLHRCDIIF